MNKKILLSTILASSILSSNFALADNVISYSGVANNTYTFTLNNQNYTSLVKLGEAIDSILQQGGEFSVDDDSAAKLQKDIFSANSSLMEGLADAFTSSGQVFSKEDVTKFASALNKLNQYGFNIFDEVELDELLTANRSELLEAAKVLQEWVVIRNNISLLVDEKLALAKELAKSNSTISNLIAERDQIIQQNNQQNNPNPDGTKLLDINQKIIAQLLASSEGAAIKNSPEAQEDLKDSIEILSAMNNLKGNNSMNFKRGAEIAKLYFTDDSTTTTKNLPIVQKSDTHTASSLVNSIITTSNIITDRVAGFAPMGVASGEPFETYGAWIKGNFSQGNQKAFKSEGGYKFNQKGVTIGVDTGDESMVGIAGSFFKNDVKSKSSSSAKDKIDTYLGTIYGMHAFNQEIFLSAQASYGKSRIKKSRLTGDLDNNSATAKTNGTLMNARAEVGYVFPINEDTQVVPSVGFAYNKADVKGYSEKGDGLNRKIGKITSQRTSGLAGVALRHVAVMGTTKVTPEIHANMDYAFNSKTSATKINLGGIFDLTTPSEKASKAFYNIGTSVKVGANDTFDITAGYDLGLSKKFISHTGALKLKVNF